MLQSQASLAVSFHCDVQTGASPPSMGPVRLLVVHAGREQGELLLLCPSV